MISLDYRCCNLCLSCTESFPEIFVYNSDIDKVLIIEENLQNLKVKLKMLERICPKGCISAQDE